MTIIADIVIIWYCYDCWYYCDYDDDHDYYCDDIIPATTVGAIVGGRRVQSMLPLSGVHCRSFMDCELASFAGSEV